MVNIVFAELEPWAQDYVKKKLKGHLLSFIDGPITEKNVSLAKNADVLCPFTWSKLPAKVIQKLKVQCIATMSTGFDHIDLKETKKRNINVSNVPAYGFNTVAQHALAHILNISKKYYDSVESTKRGDFNPWPYRGFDLKDKTLGVLGTGKIGLALIEMAKGFEMNVIAFDVIKNHSAAKKLRFKYVSLDSLFKRSDVISIHVPLFPSTKHIINKKSLSKLKKGVVIVNTSRGPVLSSEALYEGLNRGIIGAAGLDVLESEKTFRGHKVKELSPAERKIHLIDHELMRMPNVYVTPHSAFNTNEAIMRIIDTTIDNVNAFLKGKPTNVVS
ncbi:hydroxyacid dehydrogenase [Candidatus Woesearchaeota archaeon]|nr:hydroxyacid dehydrogenase [Candidatus Woesearchaeota archaeon]|tara:strand:+ start:223 stop:1212 length:990 start_codon:yes stop_codon:yes gene_type:complete